MQPDKQCLRVQRDSGVKWEGGEQTTPGANPNTEAALTSA